MIALEAGKAGREERIGLIALPSVDWLQRADLIVMKVCTTTLYYYVLAWLHPFHRYIGRLRIVVDKVRGGILVKGRRQQISGLPLLLGGSASASFIQKVRRV